MAGEEQRVMVLGEMVGEDGVDSRFLYDPNESPNERPPDQPPLRHFDLIGKAGGEEGVPTGYFRCLQCQRWINVFPSKRKIGNVEVPQMKKTRWFAESHCSTKHMPPVYWCASPFCQRRRFSSLKGMFQHAKSFVIHRGVRWAFHRLMTEEEEMVLLEEQIRRCFSHVTNMPAAPQR